MITERTLRNWRRDALRDVETAKYYLGSRVATEDHIASANRTVLTTSERILKLTQELMDLSLVRKGS